MIILKMLIVIEWPKIVVCFTKRKRWIFTEEVSKCLYEAPDANYLSTKVIFGNLYKTGNILYLKDQDFSSWSGEPFREVVGIQNFGKQQLTLLAEPVYQYES